MVYELAWAQLITLFKHKYPNFEPCTLKVNEIEYLANTPKQIINIHINDALNNPPWDRILKVYIFNLANYRLISNVIPEYTRTIVWGAVLALRELREVDINADLVALNDFLIQNATAEELADAGHPRRRGLEFLNTHIDGFLEKQGVALHQGILAQRFRKGVREGMAWLAGIAGNANYDSFTDWALDAIGKPTLREVNPAPAWELVQQIVGERLTNMGSAVTSNFLKDVGLLPFVKPDTHTKRFAELFITNLHDWDNIKDGEKDEITFNLIINLANKCSIWPRQLDRAIWLLGSGRFHYYSPLDNDRNQLAELAYNTREIHPDWPLE